jgi:hypothetical protein
LFTREKVRRDPNSEPDRRNPQSSNGLSLSYGHAIARLADVPILYFSSFRSKISAPKRVEIDFPKEKSEMPLFLDYMLSVSDSDKGLYSQCLSGLQGFLRELYEEPELELLKDDVHEDVFSVSIPGSKAFPIERMSSSYASLVNIYMELAMQSVIINRALNHEFIAIALIDELDVHMDVLLQDRVFPLLVKAFPEVQFMATTNSPFVVPTLEYSTSFDISQKSVFEKPTFFKPYTNVLDIIFNTTEGSEGFFNYWGRFEELARKHEQTFDEVLEYEKALNTLTLVSTWNSSLRYMLNEVDKTRQSMSEKEQL